MKKKVKVGYICVHNSCRSQMAEALSKHFASNVFESYSAGTEVVPTINPQAVKVIDQLYHVDMSKQSSKLIDVLPKLDIVITMGCNVQCPYVFSKYREDWGLDDPTGQDDQAFVETAKLIETKIKDFKKRVEDGLLD